ncbi:hypothetical protein AHAS_Ahas03G0138200 [Arachis hypogaea]
MEENAWKKSMNLSLYLYASSTGSLIDSPSITHNPFSDATPYRTFPLSSRKLSVKDNRKHEMLQQLKRAMVMNLLVTVWHSPWCVKAGASIWNMSTVPVGRRFARCADPLNAFLMVFIVAVFDGF